MFGKQGIECPLLTKLFNFSMSHRRGITSTSAGFLNQWACGFSSAHCVVFPLPFWSLRCLFFFYAGLCLFNFLDLYFVFHCSVCMYHRGMCQWLNKECHLNHKSEVGFFITGHLGASWAVNCKDWTNPSTLPQTYLTVELLWDLLLCETHFGKLINEMVDMTKRYFRKIV